MRYMRLKIAFILPFYVASDASAKPHSVECPANIPQQAIELAIVPKGWVPFVATPLYLHSAGMAGAPPEKLATLVGESEGGPVKTAQWSTTYMLEGPYPDGKWMECGYGESNQVILSKRLPDDTRECTVKYRKGEKAGQNHLTIVCQ